MCLSPICFVVVVPMCVTTVEIDAAAVVPGAAGAAGKVFPDVVQAQEY
jgi:hypothetical protein